MPKRWAAFTVGGVLLILVLCAWGGGRSWLWAAGDGDAASGPSTKPRLRREGTLLQDELGRFTVTGSQATFIAADGTSYIGLANLNLERIEKICASSPDSAEWLVTGAVTEYQGSNYLLISRARRKAPPQNPRSF